MALTLVEGSKRSNDILQVGVVEKLVYQDPILERLQFKDIKGNGLTYNIEATMSGAGFYAVGDNWVESTSTVDQATAVTTILGGDADVDNFLQATRSADILKYLYFTGENLGFHVSKGCCINTLEPMTELQQKKLIQKVKKASARFYKELLHPTPPPSFFRLMMFRMTRPLIKSAGEKYRDYHYYREKGWFEADYYYATSLGLPKRLAGYLFDFIGRQLVGNSVTMLLPLTH